jgi:hypothetical protein
MACVERRGGKEKGVGFRCAAVREERSLVLYGAPGAVARGGTSLGYLACLLRPALDAASRAWLTGRPG